MFFISLSFLKTNSGEKEQAGGSDMNSSTSAWRPPAGKEGTRRLFRLSDFPGACARTPPEPAAGRAPLHSRTGKSSLCFSALPYRRQPPESLYDEDSIPILNVGRLRPFVKENLRLSGLFTSRWHA